MAISAKGLRELVVAGEKFYWRVRKKISWDELHDDQIGIPIQHASGGQLLIAYVGYARSIYGAASRYAVRPITPGMIEGCIGEAISLGWKFNVPGKPVSIMDGKLSADTRVAKWRANRNMPNGKTAP